MPNVAWPTPQQSASRRYLCDPGSAHMQCAENGLGLLHCQDIELPLFLRFQRGGHSAEKFPSLEVLSSNCYTQSFVGRHVSDEKKAGA